MTSKIGAAVCAIGAVVLLVLSVIERDAGILWMPVLHVAGWMLMLVATALATYSPDESAAAAVHAEAEVKKAA